MAKAPVLFVLILLITLPFWIVVGGMTFGLIMGFIGVIFGVIGAAFGLFFGILGGIFHFIFGFGLWHPHHFFNRYVFLALIIVAALAISKRSKRVN